MLDFDSNYSEIIAAISYFGFINGWRDVFVVLQDNLKVGAS